MKRFSRLFLLLLLSSTPAWLNAEPPAAQAFSTFGADTSGSTAVLTVGLGYNNFLLGQFDFVGSPNFTIGLRGELDPFLLGGFNTTILDVSVPMRIGIITDDIFKFAFSARPGLGFLFGGGGAALNIILDPTFLFSINFNTNPAFLTLVFGFGVPMRIFLGQAGGFGAALSFPIGAEFALLSNLNIFVMGRLDIGLGGQFGGLGIGAGGTSGGVNAGIQYSFGG